MKAYCQYLWTLGTAMALTGCSVGPQYVKPDTPPIELASPQATQFNTARIDTESTSWWTFFDDQALTRRIDDALAHNHNIRLAQANLLAARAIFDERWLDRLPGIITNADYQRGIRQQMRADNQPARTLSESWRAGFDMQWEIDLFGRLDRLSEAAMAYTEASQAELDQVRLSIAAEVAYAWFEAQGLQRQLEIAEAEVRNWQETATLAESRLRVGAGLPEDVENAHSNRLLSEAAITPLTTALQQTRFRLDVLTGRRPGQGQIEPELTPTEPLVQQLPLGDADRLIHNRPDVIKAERLLAASVEDVGTATAELYPRLNLGGFIGFFALRGSDLGSASSRAFELVPNLTWPALRLGNARARLRRAEALSESALARYEQTLLNAQEEVENAITQLVEHQRYLLTLLKSARHIETAFEIASKRYHAGAGSYQSVLENQRMLFQVKQQIAVAETASYINVITLYKALGWST